MRKLHKFKLKGEQRSILLLPTKLQNFADFCIIEGMNLNLTTLQNYIFVCFQQITFKLGIFTNIV